jgi:3-isopropylmalate/(R)-2-methylmalate dehydratase small subunit
MESNPIERVSGRACVVRGDDIDTDRIIPARFLRCVSFEGIGEHAFEDDRRLAKGDHPFDDERFDGARILIVGRNFGCGSSREHAPQSLMRWGFTLGDGDLAALMDSIELDPTQEVVVDLQARRVTSRAGSAAADIPEGARKQLLEGSWNATAVLLEAGDAIDATAARIPYVQGFAP